AIYHANPGNPDDSATLSAAAGALLLRATVTDADGDVATHALDLSAGVFSLEDDGPSIAVSATAPAAASLQVDESLLGTNVSVSFANRFGNTPSYGADGAGTVGSAFALGIKSVGADSGLVDTLTGNHIYLYLSGNDVVGRVGSATTTPDPAGTVAFRVSNSGALVTLDQVTAIVHPTTQPNEAKSLSAADLITLTRTDTITDRDGDSNTGSNSINLGSAISFLDDGPTTTLTVKNTIFIPLSSVDETVGPDRYAPLESPDAGNNDDGMGWLGRVTTSVSGGLGLVNLFDVGGAYGADGAGTTNGTLSFTGIPPSGLETTLSSTAGGTITLFLESGVIVGRDANGGNPVFRIEIVNTASSGDPAVYELQTTLYEAIRHGDTALHDESIDLLMTAGEVNLNYQVIRTDGDGDRNNINSSIVLIDSSSSFFSFDDDGPMTDPSTSGQAVDSLGYLSFGTDGGYVESITLGSTTYAWNTSTNSIDVTGGPSSLIGFDAGTHLMQVTVGTGQFTVDMDDGRYNLLLTPAADFHLDVGYALVDNDGDHATGTLPIDLKVSQIGDSSGNTINGTAGSNDLLLGEDGNDILDGLSGDDLLVGGKDSDTMTGGDGADTFVWRRNDQGTGGSIDTITDFGNGQDRLDLRDLLQGEHQGAAAGTSGSLEQYLHFTTSGGNTTIEVTIDPTISTAFGLSIVLQGVTLAGADDVSKISNLLAANKLVVDL
ncbi:DUF5801 repeats-in-toxin domain-containing protein, partial [Malikia spinosa]|uniref:DUF5801 repeats-in-toxin domain-containing protein n=1 Tax=Malikia spinosa TaxID=86180 RepID=UPI0027B9DCBB